MARVPSAVKEGRLLLGPFLNAKSRSWLARHGVTHIVNATPDAPCLYEHERSYLRLTLTDEPSAQLAPHLPSLHAFIRLALARGGRVLIHCQLGKSRSAALLAAYLMREEGMPLAQAMECVRSLRAHAAPNTGFLAQLKQHERCLEAKRRSSALNAVHNGSLFARFCWMLGRAPAPIQMAFVPPEVVAVIREAEEEEAAATGAIQLGESGEGPGSISGSFALQGMRLAVDHRLHQQLWKEANAEWKAERLHVAEGALNVPILSGGLPDRGDGEADDLLADELGLPASRAMVLLSGGQSYTAWNERKRRICHILGCVMQPNCDKSCAHITLAPALMTSVHRASNVRGAASTSSSTRVDLGEVGNPNNSSIGQYARGVFDSVVGSELLLTALVLRSFPKAHEAWAHRRWVLALHRRAEMKSTGPLLVPRSHEIGGPWGSGMATCCLPRVSLAAMIHELGLSFMGLEGRKSNYHAARHATRAIRGHCEALGTLTGRGAEAEPPGAHSTTSIMTDLLHASAHIMRAEVHPVGAGVEAGNLQTETAAALSKLLAGHSILRSTGDASVLFVRRAIARAATHCLAMATSSIASAASKAADDGPMTQPRILSPLNKSTIPGIQGEVKWARSQLAVTPWQDALWAHLREMLVEVGIMCGGARIGDEGCLQGWISYELPAHGRHDWGVEEELAWLRALRSSRALGSSTQMAEAARLGQRHERWLRECAPGLAMQS